MQLETTILVEFNGGADSDDYLILSELDYLLNVDSDGETISSFGVDHEPYIIFHASDNIRIDEIVATSGGVIYIGEEAREIDDETLFSSRDEEEPTEKVFPVIPETIDVSYTGRDGSFTTKASANGVVTYTGDTTSVPFLMTTKTYYAAEIYQLIPPDLDLDEDEVYNIYVIFYVTLLE